MAFFGSDWNNGFDDDSPIGISTSMKEDIGNNYYCMENNTMSNDRFKFRVWNTLINAYEEDGFLLDVRKGKVAGQNTDIYILEQCTGILDRNNKLIYEGDVVRVEDECGICDPMMNCDTGIGVIAWECEMWYIDRKINLGLYDTKLVNYIEIIGNIHEMDGI